MESTDSNSFMVKKTPKKGMSLFSKNDISEGDTVGKLLSKTQGENEREILEDLYETNVIGRYINHSSKPNTKPKMKGEEVFLVSTKNIKGGDEITIDYGELEKLLGVLPGTFMGDDFVD